MESHENENKENQNPDWLNRWSKNLADFSQRTWPPTRDYVSRFMSQTPLSKWGKILLIAGMFLAFYFLFLYSTIVSGGVLTEEPRGVLTQGARGVFTEGGYLPINYVYSASRLQNRFLGSMAGMIMAALGALILVIDAKMPSDRE